MTLIPSRVANVIVSESRPLHTIVIAENEGPRHFSFEIGPAEVAALISKIEDAIEHTRPLTHDLALNLLESLGGNLQAVHITALRGHTFYAELLVEMDDGVVEIDARPSDALVLAAKQLCDLYVDDSVYEATSKG